MPQQGRVSFEFMSTYTKSLNSLSVGGAAVNSTVPLDYIKRQDFLTGTGAAQGDLLYAATRTLTASATEDLDFAGVLTDAFGTVLTFARIRALMVSAAAGNVNNVNVTRPASNGITLFNAASGGLSVRPGGTFLFVAPDATGQVVTASTGDLLTFTNSGSGTSVTYDIAVIGASA